MSDAFYHQGLTIEYDSSDPDPRLNIDGQPIRVVHEEGHYRVANLANPELPSLEAESLLALGEEVIENYPEYKTRKAIRNCHLAIIEKGVSTWNKWRRDHPEIRPILYNADLRGFGTLEEINFSNANLIN